MLRTTAIAFLLLSGPALALDAAEKLSQECNKAYVKLCKGIKQGPEMIGRCAIKYPDMDQKVPAKCQENFQLNVEGYNDAKGQK